MKNIVNLACSSTSAEPSCGITHGHFSCIDRTVKKLAPGLASASVAFAMLFGASSASATIMTTTLDFSFGTGAADGSSLDVIISDEAAGLLADQVKITFDLGDLFDGAKVSEIYLNFNDSSLSDSDFGAWSGDTPTITVCGDAPSCTDVSFKADGDGIFDILFAFPTSDSAAFFAGEMTMSVITFSGIEVADFIGLSSPGNPGQGNNPGPFCMAAHVQSNPDGGESDWLAAETCRAGIGDPPDIPEPSTLGLFGVGLIGLTVIARRRRKSDQAA